VKLILLNGPPGIGKSTIEFFKPFT